MSAQNRGTDPLLRLAWRFNSYRSAAVSKTSRSMWEGTWGSILKLTGFSSMLRLVFDSAAVRNWSFTPVCGLLLTLVAQTASAHNPDTSYCKVTITAHEVVCKFTYDLLTLQRIAPLDANGDGQLTRAEMEAAFPAIIRFLRERVYLDLNQREAEFAEADPLSWPEKPDTSI